MINNYLTWGFVNLMPYTSDAIDAFQTGRRYEFGQGAPMDEGKAAQFYRKAAMAGYPPAQNALGFMYATGRGVVQNNDIAVRWFKSAADAGHVAAQTNMGVMCAEGRGTDQDEILAVCYFYKAAMAGSDEAKEWLEQSLEQPSEEMHRIMAMAG